MLHDGAMGATIYERSFLMSDRQIWARSLLKPEQALCSFTILYAIFHLSIHWHFKIELHERLSPLWAFLG